ncbi:MAG: hypothetical protein LBP63_04705 [Prevotellaceae bacterium]|jgi:hypothetical protein|nr:hypothetical protein [Prevotellaceae bacterium]
MNLLKKIKAICGILLILGCVAPLIVYNSSLKPSLIDIISFNKKYSLGTEGEAMSFIAILILASAILLIIMDTIEIFYPQNNIKEKSKSKLINISKWTAIVCVAILVISCISKIMHTGLGFWLLIIAAAALLLEKQIIAKIEAQ